MLIDRGMKDRVHIDVHEVFEILPVRARDGIDRLVGIGHGIQEGIDGALRKLYEGILHGILLRTAEHGMLDDMGHAGGIGHGGPKAYIKDLVWILVFNNSDPRSAFFVAKKKPL